MLTIEVSNVARVPVRVLSVSMSHRYKDTLTEAAFGKRITKLPLFELLGDPQPPCVLDVGESVTWIANLSQLRERLEEERMRLGARSRYLDLRRIDIDRWERYGRLAIAVRNVIVKSSSWSLVVAVLDDRGGLYKAGVRWVPPGGNHLAPHRFGE